MQSKAQSWTLDIALAILIFMGAFFVFYALLNTDDNAKVSKLKDDAAVVVKQIGSEDNNIRIIDNNEINESRLGILKNLTYDELKRELRIEGDFCIYIEDEKGNIVLINNSYRGIGSPNINLNGTPCSQG